MNEAVCLPVWRLHESPWLAVPTLTKQLHGCNAVLCGKLQVCECVYVCKGVGHKNIQQFRRDSLYKIMNSQFKWQFGHIYSMYNVIWQDMRR